MEGEDGDRFRKRAEGLEEAFEATYLDEASFMEIDAQNEDLDDVN